MGKNVMVHRKAAKPQSGILILMLLFLQAGTGWSQVVTGRVTDALTGEPLPDAAVVVMPLGRGAHTAGDGTYRLELSSGRNILHISYVGYTTVREEIVVREGKAGFIRHVELSREIIEQEQVVVTADKLGIRRRSTPLNISVISRAEVEESAETNILPVLSARVPGLFVTERGVSGFGLAGGSAGKISIRGVGGGDTWFPVLLLIDGQPQFMGMMGHSIPDSYVTSDIERVEVVKGPASILYGTNAMGGAINLITHRQSREGLSFTGRVEGGSYGTLKYGTSAGIKKGGFHLLGSWNHDQSDGHRPASGFRLGNGYLRTGYAFSSHFSLDASVSRSGFKAYDPGPEFSTSSAFPVSQWVDIIRTNGYLSLANRFDRAEGGIKAYLMGGDHDIYDGWQSHDSNKGVSLYQVFRFFKGNRINVGFDYKHYGGKGSSPTLGTVSGKEFSVKENGGYLVIDQTLFGRLTLNGGLRYDHHSLFGGTWIPQAGAGFQFTSSATFKALVSKGFRNPTIRELYLFPPANPDLKPESMWNYEVSWLQGFAGNRGSFDLTGFVARGANLIVTVPNPTPPPPVKNQNSGSFSHRGAEFSLRYRFSDRLRAEGSYSYLHMEAPRISSPVHQLFMGGNYKKGKFDLSLNLHHVGKLYTLTSPNGHQTETYTLVGSKLRYFVNRYLEVFVSGENLLNQKYEVQYGYPMPGVTIFGGMQLKL